MQTLVDKQQRFLVKRFHILLGQGKIERDEKMALLNSYGVESSRDLSAKDLLDLCDKLERMIRPDLKEIDKWRKRLIASLFAWRKAMGMPSNMNEVKAIACRAAGEVAEQKGFNAISLEKLRSLYYAFSKKAKDLEKVEQITNEQIEYITTLN